MSITSLPFLLFLFGVFILYYLVPKKIQWVVLLITSILFYLTYGIQSIIYVLVTATSIYFATLWMHRIAQKRKTYLKEHKEELSKEQKTEYKKTTKRRRKWAMLLALMLNIGILCVFKYLGFAIEQINTICSWFGGVGFTGTFALLAPLGLSFYTFQAIGYLVDCYWEYYEPEKNYFKVLLFVSFFPQMTQGPISDFEYLSKELFTEHKLDYKNYSWGFQRMIWGFAKKMLIADMLSGYVTNLFSDYSTYTGISTLIGILMYSIQIYADFSGYMDIMCGFCEVLGIHLTENFNRPYFSKSISEYWRRWHISLGAWFKKYIYYPIGTSNWSRKIATKTKRFGKHFSNSLPATIALIVTWFATGLWHGAKWGYIIWGLINGFIIIFSMWMEPVYIKIKKALHIKESAWLWRAFQVLRTFALVSFIKILPEVGSFKQGLSLCARVFTAIGQIPSSFKELLPMVNFDKLTYLVIAFVGTAVLFIFSLLQRKRPVRTLFNKIPMFFRVLILVAIMLLVLTYGIKIEVVNGGGFMYANF